MLLAESCRAVCNASTSSLFSPFLSLSCAFSRYKNVTVRRVTVASRAQQLMAL